MTNPGNSWKVWAASALLAWAPLAEAQDTGLRLTIRSEQESYLVAEPVFIRIELRNQGGTPVAVSPELALETELTSLFIAGPGDEAFERYSPGIVVEPSKPRRQLEPSEEIEHQQLVIFHWPARDFAFPTPGRYRLRVLHHGFGERPDVQSNVLEIEVRAPSGGSAEAMALFRRQDVAALVLNIDEPQAAVQNLETLMARHRNTPYADYAQFYLARRETQEFFSRKPDPQKAIRLLNDLVSRKPDFVLADKAYLKLGALHLQLGERQKAEASIRKALTLSPDEEAKEMSQRLLQKMNAAAPPPKR